MTDTLRVGLVGCGKHPRGYLAPGMARVPSAELVACADVDAGAARRLADEMGADIVKLNVPKFADGANLQSPAPYRELYESWKGLDENEAYRRAVEKIVASAGKTLVLFSGGSKMGDEDLLLKARIVMEAGATGLIFGRNMWQRPFDEGLAISAKVKELLLSF